MGIDERGRGTTTREAPRRSSQSWQTQGRDIAFVVGGADGLAASVTREADFLWSLSPLTLPHGLVRVIVAEQLYRAFSILSNHPYHRGNPVLSFWFLAFLAVFSCYTPHRRVCLG